MKRLKDSILFAGSPWQRLRSMPHNIPGLACQDNWFGARTCGYLPQTLRRWVIRHWAFTLGSACQNLPGQDGPNYDIGQDYNPQLQEKYQRFSRNNHFQRYTKGLEKLFLWKQCKPLQTSLGHRLHGGFCGICIPSFCRHLWPLQDLKPSKRDTVPLLEAFTFTTWKCFSDFHNCIHMYIYVLNYIYNVCVFTARPWISSQNFASAAWHICLNVSKPLSLAKYNSNWTWPSSGSFADLQHGTEPGH